jgi:hypothetical protein
MLSFTSPSLTAGSLEHALTRTRSGAYALIYARAYGMAASRIFSSLTTSPSTAFSASGRPLLWIDAEIDADPRNLGPAGGVPAALLAAEPAVVAKTGPTRPSGDGKREVVELELLLVEENLARCCYYCEAVETTSDVGEDRMVLLSGEGYQSTYCCSQVCLRNEEEGVNLLTMLVVRAQEPAQPRSVGLS